MSHDKYKEVAEWLYAQLSNQDSGRRSTAMEAERRWPWLAEKRVLNETVSINPRRRDGTPVITNTKLSVTTILAEIANGNSIRDIAANYRVEKAAITRFIDALATWIAAHPEKLD